MLFNSIEFIFYFIFVTFAYYKLPHRYRWILLVAASCIFYMWFIPKYILILFTTIIVDYFAGIYIEKSSNLAQRKAILIFSVIITCIVLVFFKYFSFLEKNIEFIAQQLGWNYSITGLKVILPIGLSFHTFQSLSYVIEVYRGNQKAEKNFGIYTLYVMFYPQLVAGPIERPQNLLHQFYEEHQFNIEEIFEAGKRIGWGLFKKIVIADRLAFYVNKAYENPSSFSGLTLTICTVFFAIQIYCDFSGYSDIAIGAARAMGFKLMENFDRPYFSKSISEFWRRWHISLSTWFKDYVYVSLGGNRVGYLRLQYNLMITFLISGLWHGANWTFIVWGGLNGVYLVIENTIKKFRKTQLKVNNIILSVQNIFVFAIICIAWIYFRAEDISTGNYILKKIVFNTESIENYTLLFSKNELIYCLILILFLFSVEFLQKTPSPLVWIKSKNRAMRWLFYYFIIFSILFLMPFDSHQSFIYFQF